MHVPIPNSARFNSPNMFPNVPVNPIKLSPRHSKKIFLEKKDMNRVKTKKKMFVFTFNRLLCIRDSDMARVNVGYPLFDD